MADSGSKAGPSKAQAELVELRNALTSEQAVRATADKAAAVAKVERDAAKQLADEVRSRLAELEKRGDEK